MDYQIITDLFDVDYYKLLMLFYKWYYHPDVSVEFTLINRTDSVRIADIVPIEAFREQLDAARTLRFDSHHLAFLQGTRDFSKGIAGFKDYLLGYQLPEYDLSIKNGQFVLKADSPDSSLLETIAMSTLNQLLNHFRLKALGIPEHLVYQEAERVAMAKANAILEANFAPNTILEFGTRRRYSRNWQYRVYDLFQNEVPHIISATSNVALAISTNSPWAGTLPHEGVQLEQGIALPYGSGAVRASHNLFFTNWWKLFPYPFRVALTDTYGDAFWSDFSADNALLGRGLRWDSGDWRTWVDQSYDYYTSMGINPAHAVDGKDGFFSDGLTVETMVEINQEASWAFRSVLFGWGTDATNDMGKYRKAGLTPVSIVMKTTAVNGRPVVKLSRNPSKSTGEAAAVANIRKIFDYQANAYKAVAPVY